jgi:iron-sulfur cluster repair protein YtfE (RIC family)
LSHDHHHGLALALQCRKQALGQIKPAGAAELWARATELCSFLAQELGPHFRAEEEILFPAIRSGVPESASLLDDLLRDHVNLRQRVQELTQGPGLSKQIFDVADLLERHIRREERELFPLFERHIEARQAELIGAEISKILATRLR